MATITPKEKDGKIIAYKFRACVGRDENGRQVSRATTWKIPENLSMTRLTSAAQRAAVDWERQAQAEYEKDLYDPERVKAREIDRTKLARKQVDALSQDEAAAFFAALQEQPLDFRCLLHLLITTGIRRGECIGLKWGDLDEKGGTITIQRNVVYTPESGVVVGTPKTAASVRVIPIMQSTLSLLLMLKAQRKRENPGTILADSFIFPGEAGIFEARDPNAVTRRVKRFMKAHGLPDLSPTTCGTAAPPCFWAAERTLRASKRFWATSTPARPSISISRLTCGKCRRPPKN